jgi:hypothetical protein
LHVIRLQDLNAAYVETQSDLHSDIEIFQRRMVATEMARTTEAAEHRQAMYDLQLEKETLEVDLLNQNAALQTDHMQTGVIDSLLNAQRFLTMQEELQASRAEVSTSLARLLALDCCAVTLRLRHYCHARLPALGLTRRVLSLCPGQRAQECHGRDRIHRGPQPAGCHCRRAVAFPQEVEGWAGEHAAAIAGGHAQRGVGVGRDGFDGRRGRELDVSHAAAADPGDECGGDA